MKLLSAALSITVILLLFDTPGIAQLINWNSAPRKGFVFKISNKEAQKLLTRSTPDTIFNGLLHTQIDTFDVRKGWVNRPSKGHFILATINENKLHCEYTSVFPYQVFLLKEYDALSLQVVDFDGNVREDAKVKLKVRRLRIDPESKTYRIENAWFNDQNKIVTVELDGFRSVFNIEKHDVTMKTKMMTLCLVLGSWAANTQHDHAKHGDKKMEQNMAMFKDAKLGTAYEHYIHLKDDRAAFHFLTTEISVAKYLSTIRNNIVSKGHLILDIFSENGPKKCNGLEIQQYSEISMSSLFDKDFKRIKCIKENHITPLNATQHFLFCSFEKKISNSKLTA